MQAVRESDAKEIHSFKNSSRILKKVLDKNKEL